MAALSDLDPDTIEVTVHALQRYLERRGQRPVPRHYAHAEAKLRGLLRKLKAHGLGVEPKVLPATSDAPNAGVRRLVTGGFVIVVQADYSRVITFFPDVRPQRPVQPHRAKVTRPKAERRPRHVLRREEQGTDLDDDLP